MPRNDLPDVPIYYVVAIRDYSTPWGQMYSLGHIVGVYNCNLSEIDDIYQRVVLPLGNAGGAVYTYIFLREPANPFRDWKPAEEQIEAGPAQLDTPPEPWSLIDQVTIYDVDEEKPKPEPSVWDI